MNRPFEKKHLDMVYGFQEMTSFMESHFPSVAPNIQVMLIYNTLKVWRWMVKSRKCDPESLGIIKKILRQYSWLINSSKISKIAKIQYGIIRLWPQWLCDIRTK